MNSKGFTLFTALISFVLIALTGVLVVSMLNTERAVTDTISTVDEQSEMQSTADLARADAVQAFNYGVRMQIEKMIAQEGTDFYVLKDSVLSGDRENDWKQIIQDFAASEFGSEQGGREFSNRMTNHLILLLENTTSTSKYNICLVLNDGATCAMRATDQDNTKFNNNLQKLVLEMAQDNEKPLLEPIKCGSQDCEIGTFYINLDFSKLSDEEYEELPKIRVESLVSGRAIMEPILPKGNLRIYVPLRLFLALRKSQDIGYDLFSLSDEYSGWGLGMCESDCSIRVDPFGKSKKIETNPCPGDKRTVQFTSAELECGGCPDYYNPNDSAEMKEIIGRIFEDSVCGKVDTGGGTQLPENFSLTGPEECAGLKFRAIEAFAFETKTIHHMLGKLPTQYDDGTAYCVMPTTMNIFAEFEEKNKQYMVDKTVGSSKYRVKFVSGLRQKDIQKSDCYSIDDDGSCSCSERDPRFG